MLGTVYMYKSVTVMKQGPMYVNDLCVINENSKSKRQFPLVQSQFLFSYQASHFWNLLVNCFKDQTALREREGQCPVAQNVVLCVKEGVLYITFF